MGAAIWSTSLEEMEVNLNLPFIQFFYNHGLLDIANRLNGMWYPKVRVLTSRSFFHAWTNPSLWIHRLKQVIRNEAGVTIEFEDGATQDFDEVIFAVVTQTKPCVCWAMRQSKSNRF